jgi:hypothetical protein
MPLDRKWMEWAKERKMWLTPAEFKKTMIYKLVYALERYMHDSMTPQIKSTHATGCLAQHSF